MKSAACGNMHTHIRHGEGAPELVSVPVLSGVGFESLEFHPWRLPEDPLPLPPDFAAALPRAAALGEVGLDVLRGPDLKRQMRCLEALLSLAEEYRKPVVFHCVRAFPELLRLTSELTVPKLMHNFRGGVRLLESLREKNWLISFRHLDHPEVIASLRRDGLSGIGFETDDDPELDIIEVVRTAERQLDMAAKTAGMNTFRKFLGL